METSLVNRFETFVFVVILSVTICGYTLAQIPGAMNETTSTRLGGNNYLAGTVYSPSGLPIDVRMGIRLRSPMAGEVMASTDSRGQFIFSGLAAGTYSVTIDGEKDFEPVSQSVEITQSRSPSPQTYNVSIRLTGRANPDLKPGVISSLNAGVPKHAMTFYQKALDHSTAGDHNAAIEQLKLAIKEFPQFFMALNELGVQYLKLNDLEKADEALQTALKIKPDAFEPLMNRGIAFFRLKRYVDAEPILRKAVALDGKSSVAHFYLGRTYLASGRPDDAITELKQTIATGGDKFKESHRLLAVLYLDKGEWNLVVEELETYLRLVQNAKDADELRQVIKQSKAQPAKPSS